MDHWRGTAPQRRRCVRIGDVSIDVLDRGQALRRIEGFLDVPRFHQVATCNLSFLRIAKRDPAFRQILDRADLVTADGMPLVWLSKLFPTPLPERVTGVGLVPELLRLAARRGDRVYFLGGGEDALAFAARASLDHPGLRIAGVDTRWVDVDDERTAGKLADEIRAAQASLVLVAFGAPKQELFLARYGERLGARVGIGVGAAFAMLGGRVPRAPRWMRDHGAEWIWRLAREPRRLSGRYAKDALSLLGLALRTAASGLATPSPASLGLEEPALELTPDEATTSASEEAPLLEPSTTGAHHASAGH